MFGWATLQRAGHQACACCRASLLATFAPQALLLALAAKLRVSKSGNLAQPPRHSAYGPRNPRGARAAGFLGACFPATPGSAWGAKQVTDFLSCMRRHESASAGFRAACPLSVQACLASASSFAATILFTLNT